MQHRILTVLLLVCSATGFWLYSAPPQPVQAQPRITNTNVPVIIPTVAPTQPPQSNETFVEASPSPTFTPTQPLPDARLVSIAPPGTALIREFPEDGTILGVLQDNTDYQVLGQYFSWYQIQLPTAPNGIAWVYFEDIQVSGNLNDIPFADPNAQPAQLSQQDIATATARVLFQTPGFAETATAESRVLEIPQETQAAQSSGNSRLPTYTPPADIVALQATQIPDSLPTPIVDINFVDATLSSISEGDVPPVLPITALAVAGLLGLLIASFRR